MQCKGKGVWGLGGGGVGVRDVERKLGQQKALTSVFASRKAALLRKPARLHSYSAARTNLQMEPDLGGSGRMMAGIRNGRSGEKSPTKSDNERGGDNMMNGAELGGRKRKERKKKYGVSVSNSWRVIRCVPYTMD